MVNFLSSKTHLSAAGQFWKKEENESSDLLLHPVTEHLKYNSGSLQFGEIWDNSHIV